MDPRTAKTFFSPWWRGVKKNHAGIQTNFIPAVFDTETCYAHVYASGFFDGGVLSILHGHKKDHLTWFLDQCGDLAVRDGTAIVAGHFIIFDLGVLFWKTINPLNSKRSKAPRRSWFSMLEPRCTIEIYWSRPCFGSIKFENGTVQLIDTYAFFNMSLRKALKAIGSKNRKLKKPDHLGRRIIPSQELTPYLSMDLRGTHDLLMQILKFHKEYKTRLCVSSPMLAGKIFRHFYMNRDFPKPGRRLMSAALLSYHGGKNSFPEEPGWFKDCRDLDINSAYPEAMRQLPDFGNGRWRLVKGKAECLEYPHGIYCVTGYLRECKWGILFSNDFKRLSGFVRDQWVTSYEYREAVLSGEFEVTQVSGWAFQENRKAGISPFKLYVDDFYKKKSEAKDKGWREFFKHQLTDLYGKFIARIEDDDGDRLAGSMFDPAIASLITGFVRARVHRLEHKYRAIHTATDGFITQSKPDPKDMGFEIGKLKEVVHGPVVILRNKLYIHYDNQGRMKKSGLHGFELGPRKLLKLWKSANRNYRVEHLVRWNEAWHCGLPPGMPIFRSKELYLK